MIAGVDGIIESARPGHIVICMATIDPFAARALAETLAAKGIAMIDAPVSGGTGRALSGELSVIVGGDAAVVARCKDLFDVMGSQTFHVGPLGHGLAMKLVKQHAGAGQHRGGGRGAGAGRQGRPRSQDDLRRGARLDRRQCGVGAARAAHPRGRLRAGGTIDISYKDQELETAFAKRLGVPLLLANLTQQVYQMARAQGSTSWTARRS